MITVVDSCSLLSLVRYYLPFDKKKILIDRLMEEVKQHQLIILDKVKEECSKIAKGIVLDMIPQINGKEYITKTDTLTMPKRFYEMLDNNFVNGSVKRKLDGPKYDDLRTHYLQSADAYIIAYIMKHSHTLEGIQVLTEETETSNDNKVFFKIPAIMKQIMQDNKNPTLTLPEYIKTLDEIDISINKNLGTSHSS